MAQVTTGRFGAARECTFNQLRDTCSACPRWVVGGRRRRARLDALAAGLASEDPVGRVVIAQNHGISLIFLKRENLLRNFLSWYDKERHALSGAMWKSKFYDAFVLNHRMILHAIDAMPARWRGDAGSSPLDRARTAASSPRHLTHA